MNRSRNTKHLSTMNPSTVRSSDEIQLMRLLHGELRGPDAAALRERMAREPDLAKRHAELEETWSAFESAAPVPAETPDIAAAVRARLGEADPGSSSSWLVNAWLPGGLVGQLAAAGTLLLGAGLGWWAPRSPGRLARSMRVLWSSGLRRHRELRGRKRYLARRTKLGRLLNRKWRT